MQNPSRLLPLTGASNFRDLGGYVGEGGRTVRWRRLFRSDHLGSLTAEDVSALSGLGITRICDFRGKAEGASTPCSIPGVAVHSLAIEPTVVQGMQDLLATGHRLTPQDTVRLMEETYRAFVHDNAARFGDLFRHLLSSDAPLVFHCTAGKDRTGFAAALILLTLGVPRPIVMQDYLLTNDYFRMPVAANSPLAPEVLQVLWRVQQEFLDAALHAVDADYGGVQAYLTQAMGVNAGDQQQLASLYLQP